MSNISLEEPRKLISQLVTKFVPANDGKLINSINEFHRIMRSWIKKVEAAKWDAQRPADKTEVRHAERMNELERERFSLVKAIDELELSQQQLSCAVKAAEQKSQHIKTQMQALDSPMMSQEQLQFEMFRSLGIEWLDTDLENPGKVRCRVKSSSNNDIYTFGIEGSHNPFFCSNYLWDLCDQ